MANDEGMYRWICHVVRESRTKDEAARVLFDELRGQKTPDGAKYSYSAIRAGLVDWR
jgi:hypothetical protein